MGTISIKCGELVNTPKSTVLGEIMSDNGQNMVSLDSSVVLGSKDLRIIADLLDSPHLQHGEWNE